MTDPKTLLTFNGIDGSTGAYLQEPMLLADFTKRHARGFTVNPKHLGDLNKRRFDYKKKKYAVKEGVEPKLIEQAGWGVIFAIGESEGVRKALRDLLDHRKKQANEKKELYKEYFGDSGGKSKLDGYFANETKLTFLSARGGGVGPVDPDKIPYYLLIVGGPEKIPYSFQYQLDVQYAVGRIAFDTPAEYAQYAHNVVLAETKGKVVLPRRAAFFGTSSDAGTQLSAENLVQPLAASTKDDKPLWAVESYLEDKAKKASLGGLLSGEDTPAFLFTASHGLWMPKTSSSFREVNGALVCQEYDEAHRPKNTPVPDSEYFSAADLPSNANLLGLISMHFACFGAGTPSISDYPDEGQAPARIARDPFVARLPQKMLLNGALAVVGHIERAWSYSFLWDGAGQQIQVFQSALKRLMEGHPIGSAMEYFNMRYAELSSDLTSMLDEYGKQGIDDSLAAWWMWNNDARGYIVLGDPAVKLMTGSDDSAVVTKVELERITVTAETAPAPAAVPSGVSFAAGDGEDHAQPGRLARSIIAIAEKLAATLGDAFKAATTVDVALYSAPDLAGVEFDKEKNEFTAPAKLVARTRGSLDGNNVSCVREQNGKLDEDVLKLHNEMVQKSLESRQEMLKLAKQVVVDLASSTRE